jgi:hypothetical protein
MTTTREFTMLAGERDVAELRSILQFGDVLLYLPSGAFSKLITIKTWSEFSHCELYVGGVEPTREVWAARDPERWVPTPAGGGVNFYPLRTHGLAVIRRPREPIDVAAVRAFCERTAGQRYDWWGLARFFRIGAGKRDRMFCSEALTRALRLGGPVLFDNCDADEVAPGMLDTTRDLFDVWRLRR